MVTRGLSTKKRRCQKELKVSTQTAVTDTVGRKLLMVKVITLDGAVLGAVHTSSERAVFTHSSDTRNANPIRRSTTSSVNSQKEL
jgi:hypothetical protein